MRVLVAGGAGYVGSVLVPKLMERGHEVEVIDLLWFGNHLPPGVRTIEKDLMTVTENDLSWYDQVIFIAGLSNDPMAEFSPAKNFVSNAALPAYLCYMAKRAGVKRFIFGCSCSVYGFTANEMCDETSVAASNYPYGISKLQGEYGCLSLQDKNFSVISLRKGTVSGYSARMRLDLIVNTMFKAAFTERVITVNNPDIWRPIVDVRDAAEAYALAVEANHRISGVFNVAYDNFTVGEVAAQVRDEIKNSLGIDARINMKNTEDFRNYMVRTKKARKVLGFNPKHNIRSIVASLAENIDRFRDFDNPIYYNIQVFKQLEAKQSVSVR